MSDNLIVNPIVNATKGEITRRCNDFLGLNFSRNDVNMNENMNNVLISMAIWTPNISCNCGIRYLKYIH